MARSSRATAGSVSRGASSRLARARTWRSRASSPLPPPRSPAAWAELLAGPHGATGRAALTTSLAADCSILSAESLARAMHAAPRHAQLLADGCAELRKQLVRRHRQLATPRFLGLQLIDVLLGAVQAIGRGEAFGLAANKAAAKAA